MARLTNTESIQLPDDIQDGVYMYIMVDKATIDKNKSLVMDIFALKNHEDVTFNICVRQKRRKDMLPTYYDYYYGGYSYHNQEKDCEEYCTTTVFAIFKAKDIEPMKLNGKFDGFTIGGTMHKQMIAFTNTPLASEDMFRFVCENVLHGRYNVFSLGKNSFIKITETYEGEC